MAIAIVAHTYYRGLYAGTSSSIDTTGASFLVGHSAHNPNTTSNSLVSDSKSNTWTQLTASTITNRKSSIWYVNNPAVGSGHTFSVTGDTIASNSSFAAFSGTDTTSVYDNTENGTTNSSSTTISASITPSADNELVICGALNQNNNTISSGPSGYSLSDSAPSDGATYCSAGMWYLIQTTAGATTPQVTWGASENGAMRVASFKPQAAANDTLFAQSWM